MYDRNYLTQNQNERDKLNVIFNYPRSTSFVHQNQIRYVFNKNLPSFFNTSILQIAHYH